MKKHIFFTAVLVSLMLGFAPGASSFLGGNFKTLTPENGVLKIPVKQIDDGNAHYFKTKSDNGVMVSFFTLKSKDGVIRAAIDACDVCYRGGKGYVQEGDFMVCEKCGQKFLSSRINIVKGGCNPAPLERINEDGFVIIKMADINQNSWYCEYKKQ
jgi:uncharacterized membrane protein